MTSSSATGRDRRLGKGLAALLGSDLEESGASSAEGAGGQSGIQSIVLPVDQIENNPFQPRRDFNPEEIASLAESIKNHQQLQPILVRIVDGRYQLISGERRLRATIHAGMPTIRAEVREADDRLVAELAIIENLQRKDLNPIEKALSFKRYIEEHKCKQDDLARRLSIDRSTIANLMRLLELPDPVLDMLQEGKVTAGHAQHGTLTIAIGLRLSLVLLHEGRVPDHVGEHDRGELSNHAVQSPPGGASPSAARVSSASASRKSRNASCDRTEPPVGPAPAYSFIPSTSTILAFRSSASCVSTSALS